MVTISILLYLQTIKKMKNVLFYIATLFLSYSLHAQIHEFGVFAGIVIGAVGLLINWYYKAKQDRREEREHKKRMEE